MTTIFKSKFFLINIFGIRNCCFFSYFKPTNKWFQLTITLTSLHCFSSEYQNLLNIADSTFSINFPSFYIQILFLRNYKLIKFTEQLYCIFLYVFQLFCLLLFELGCCCCGIMSIKYCRCISAKRWISLTLRLLPADAIGRMKELKSKF